MPLISISNVLLFFVYLCECGCWVFGAGVETGHWLIPHLAHIRLLPVTLSLSMIALDLLMWWHLSTLVVVYSSVSGDVALNNVTRPDTTLHILYF